MNQRFDEAQRLAKRLAAQLGCSRSEAERFIAGGWVRVDGRVVEAPEERVLPGQNITLDAGARPEDLGPVTVLWHKPSGVLLPDGLHLPTDTALQWLADDRRAAADRSRIRPLRVHRQRLQPLLPLGQDACGLMVFTQSPGVARALADAAGDLEHEWLLDLPAQALPPDLNAREAVLRALIEPMSDHGRRLPAARASWQSDRRLRLAVKGAQPGQVAFWVDRAGLLLSQRRRQRIGRVALSGLATGQWRYLLPTERF